MEDHIKRSLMSLRGGWLAFPDEEINAQGFWSFLMRAQCGQSLKI